LAGQKIPSADTGSPKEAEELLESGKSSPFILGGTYAQFSVGRGGEAYRPIAGKRTLAVFTHTGAN
jgi:hypothetical protein